MSNTGAHFGQLGGHGRRARWQESPSAGLYSPAGARKYLNEDERRRVIAAAEALPFRRRLFVLTLLWTGARISEVLALSRSSFQLERGIVAIRTLKRRRFHVREVPIPPPLCAALDAVFGLLALSGHQAGERLWPFSRTTAWRIVNEVMRAAGLRGVAACPKGLRHSFGITALQSGAPLNLVQRWLGHASISTTAIYADATGPEEMGFAARLWLAVEPEKAARMSHYLRQKFD